MSAHVHCGFHRVSDSFALTGVGDAQQLALVDVKCAGWNIVEWLWGWGIRTAAQWQRDRKSASQREFHLTFQRDCRGAPFTLTVTGSNFVSGSVVNWAGTALTTTFGSSTSLDGQCSSFQSFYGRHSANSGHESHAGRRYFGSKEFQHQQSRAGCGFTLPDKH